MRLMRIICTLGLIMAGLSILWPSYAQEPSARPVHVLTMKAAVGPAMAGYLEGGIERAQKDNAQLLIVELDTPGGLLTTTRLMVQDIIESPVPIAVWVTPSGAHAASAGTFLVYASHIAAMDQGTNLGAATPIKMGSPMTPPSPAQEPADNPQQENTEEGDKTDSETNKAATDLKALEDTAAFIRGLAEMRGRNARWAEAAVIDAKSLTAREALEQNVIDMISDSREGLIMQVDGRKITLKDKTEITLSTENAAVKVFEPDWRTKILAMITDPNIAFILMTLGVYGLILEFYNPGTFIPGTIGAICLIIALYALNVLPVTAAGTAHCCRRALFHAG